jgi:hypothetical protein
VQVVILVASAVRLKGLPRSCSRDRKSIVAIRNVNAGFATARELVISREFVNLVRIRILLDLSLATGYDDDDDDGVDGIRLGYLLTPNTARLGNSRR